MNIRELIEALELASKEVGDTVDVLDDCDLGLCDVEVRYNKAVTLYFYEGVPPTKARHPSFIAMGTVHPIR